MVLRLFQYTVVKKVFGNNRSTCELVPFIWVIYYNKSTPTYVITVRYHIEEG